MSKMFYPSGQATTRLDGHLAPTRMEQGDGLRRPGTFSPGPGRSTMAEGE